MIEIISWTLEFFAVIGCLYKFQQKKLKIDVALIGLLIYDFLIFYGINHLKLPLGLSISVYLAIYIFSIYKFKKRYITNLVECFLAYIFLAILQLLCYIPIVLIISDPYKDVLIGCLVNALSCFIVNLLGDKLKIHKVSKYIEKHNLLTYVCLNCVIIYLGINIYNLRMVHFWSGRRFLEIAIWLILIMILWFQVQKNKDEKEERERQLQNQKRYVQNFEEQLLEVRYKQHDLKNHLAAFQGLAGENEENKELISMQENYCNYVLQEDAYKRLVKGGNPIITGFLNEKIKEMEDKKISFQYDLAYVELPRLEIYEWIEVLGILLDNAIEAVEHSAEELRKISLKLIQESEITLLGVANVSRYIGSEESRAFFTEGYSSKGSGRGLGLPKVKKIIHKKEGEISVSNINRENHNWLEFRISIRNESK
ncbi:MAG: GHKL domain-containing protein [Lachnospiraceae bacterium]|nr:GHKL domain-containing protein [Lachnospiraceae bacterium]